MISTDGNEKYKLFISKNCLLCKGGFKGDLSCVKRTLKDLKSRDAGCFYHMDDGDGNSITNNPLTKEETERSEKDPKKPAPFMMENDCHEENDCHL